jgi:hypothetical protein
MFMAAAPQGQVDLDFEREEATVLAAMRGDGRVHVIVEETGSLEFLRGRLASEEGPFEAVHLSCHGDIDKSRGPVLLLETAEGGADRVHPGQVVQALGATAGPAGGAFGVPHGGDRPGERRGGWRGTARCG